ncbi:MAG: hypothetical protein HQL13_02335 [Candidatus Omnitrophica bacterium]|nr:hypothetical protein [Candidatus Omnitrophota bacterium]
MNIFSCPLGVLIFVLTFLLSAQGGVFAQQNNSDVSAQTMMTPTNQVQMPDNGTAEGRKALVDSLHLKTYAAFENRALCQGDEKCLNQENIAKLVVCLGDLCDGSNPYKKPQECFQGRFENASKKVMDNAVYTMCSLVKSHDAKARQDLLGRFPGSKESYLINYFSYYLAMKQSAQACEAYIKDYVGAYGPQWNWKEYRMLSGCRILAHATTLKQEENDYFTWFGVLQGVAHCSDIVNPEMRQACNTPSAGTPVPSL